MLSISKSKELEPTTMHFQHFWRWLSSDMNQKLLISYFRSGWAFLIPYLAAYLLYAWLKWPVNPTGDTGFQLSVLSSQPSFVLHLPCLLHVYWALHGIHLVLGATALRAWWKGLALKLQLPTSTGAPSAHLPSTVSQSGHRLLPWAFLALLFYIPGVYMEFPADPWQHYARVNEWSWLQTVTEHSYWKKSSYFLAYSFIGKIAPPLLQLKWFDVYYTVCCLLLCWQYYRLARAIGFSERTSMIFVLLNVLLFGNNIFGFYRYYGMSSTLFAQLSAVAMTRIAIEMARGRLKAGGRRPENNDPSESQSVVLSWLARLSRSDPEPVERAVSCLLQLAGSSILLLPLIAFNHVQGLGFAAFGITAVGVWRLIEWRRSMVAWLALLAVVLSVATVLWYPRHPLLDSVYVPQGWMTSWYGFNFFQPSSAGFQRAWLIPGLLGAINILCGLFLLRRNSLVGWLTILPVFVLMLPCVAIPFANSLAASIHWDEGYIIAFHRMLFAIPAGLAFVALFQWRDQESVHRLAVPNDPEPACAEPIEWVEGLRLPFTVYRLPSFTILLSALLLIALVPAGRPAYNRLYNVLMVPAQDVAMRHVVSAPLLEQISAEVTTGPTASDPRRAAVERARVLAMPGIAYALNSTGVTEISLAQKSWATISASGFVDGLRERLLNLQEGSIRHANFLSTNLLFTPLSATAFLSGHWVPVRVALEHAAQSELFSYPRSPSRPPQIWIQWYSPRDKTTRFFAKGSGQDMPPDDRGRLDTGTGNQAIRADDTILFQPVMRTFNNSGWQLTLKITGPGMTSARTIKGHLVPLSGLQWLYEDHALYVKQPGRYDVELIGTTLWPEVTTTVRYHFVVQPQPAQ